MNKSLDIITFLRSLNWKVFFMSAAAVFCMTLLQYLGVRVPNLAQKITSIIRPVPKPDSFQPIKEKLRAKQNTFSLHESTGLIPQASAATDVDNASAYSVIDFDSGSILLRKSANEQLPIASLTKIMAAVVALDLADKDEFITISPVATRVVPTTIGVVPGQQMKLVDLLEGMLLTSANDAAESVRDGIDTKYQRPIFIQAMNEKAKALGLAHTHFTNPQGFDSANNYSTANDLAVLTHYALTNYPVIAAITQKDYDFLPGDQNHKQFDLYNWNGLLDVYPGVKGVKIGNTEAAKYTTIVLSERSGEDILAVLLGAPGVLQRDLWAAELLDAGFTRAQNLAPVSVTKEQLRAKYATWKYFN